MNEWCRKTHQQSYTHQESLFHVEVQFLLLCYLVFIKKSMCIHHNGTNKLEHIVTKQESKAF